MRYWQACECAALELESAAYNAGMTLTEFFVNQKKAGRQRTRQVTSLLREEHMSWRPVLARWRLAKCFDTCGSPKMASGR